MMAHVKIVDRWDEGEPARVPADAKIRARRGGGKLDACFTTVYADDYLLVGVQHSSDDMTPLTATASLVSDHVRLFARGEDGVTPILARKKSTD